MPGAGVDEEDKKKIGPLRESTAVVFMCLWRLRWRPEERAEEGI